MVDRQRKDPIDRALGRKVGIRVPATYDQFRHLRDRLSERQHRIRQSLGIATDQRVHELYRRAAEGPSGDGYPASSGSDGGGRSVGSHGDPTAETVVRHSSPNRDGTDTWQGRRESDVVGEQIADAAKLVGLLGWLLDKADQAAEDLRRTFQALDATADLARDRERLPNFCKACEREVASTSRDPFLSGYCEPCYKAWVRAGRPVDAEHRSWVAERRAYLSERRAS